MLSLHQDKCGQALLQITSSKREHNWDYVLELAVMPEAWLRRAVIVRFYNILSRVRKLCAFVWPVFCFHS